MPNFIISQVIILNIFGVLTVKCIPANFDGVIFIEINFIKKKN